MVDGSRSLLASNAVGISIEVGPIARVGCRHWFAGLEVFAATERIHGVRVGVRVELVAVTDSVSIPIAVGILEDIGEAVRRARIRRFVRSNGLPHPRGRCRIVEVFVDRWWLNGWTGGGRR